MMKRLYKAILGLDAAWKIDEVIVNDFRQEITVHVSDNGKNGHYKCPKCQCGGARYHDTKEKQIAYFNTCDYKTWIELKYARVICPYCGMVEMEPEFIKKIKKEEEEGKKEASQ